MTSESSRGEKLAGLTLDDVLAQQKRAAGSAATPPPSQPIPRNRTLLDIIKDDETNKKDRRSWKAFKDKLRLKRAGSAWTSSIHIPTSDVPISHPNTRNPANFGRRNSTRYPESDMYNTRQAGDLDPTMGDSNSPATKPSFTRRESTRFDPSDSNPGLRPMLSRRDSTHVVQSDPYRRGRVVTFLDDDDNDDDDGGDDYDCPPDPGRTLSAREAVAAQEAAEAAAAAAEEEDEELDAGPVTMSLMDLLSETDREMGLEGSRYILSDEEDEFDDDDEDNGDDEDEDGGGGSGALEHSCCICMVRHKGAALVPCGHTFCRMCSRELMVSKGNCPICNNFVLEILDIF